MMSEPERLWRMLPEYIRERTHRNLPGQDMEYVSDHAWRQSLTVLACAGNRQAYLKLAAIETEDYLCRRFRPVIGRLVDEGLTMAKIVDMHQFLAKRLQLQGSHDNTGDHDVQPTIPARRPGTAQR